MRCRWLIQSFGRGSPTITIQQGKLGHTCGAGVEDVRSILGMEMSNTLTCALAGGAMLLLAGATSASAADNGFCRDYARAALHQVRGALSNRRCTFHMENETRWSSDFRTHYDWCRGVSRDQADQEREARRRALEHCAR